ncbi:arrestin domain-containing protein 4-like isoform X1 [Frankliniella occidentalis]|uniref:Arrestin domain-containing protein 4-like isoform X1 n=1 Tax=Frankliniella occidentalis TaxID=133901 RepID=A0A9C6U6X1_FRAOC|nr:arrestin domain-containing protein 4-like isoform X1 [Frankliniella occidentalis]
MSVIIVYDRPSAEYLAGETVTGRVIVHLDQPTSIKEITLRLKGETKLDGVLALLNQMTAVGTILRLVNPPHEIFYKSKTQLLGGGDKPKHQDTKLEPGTHAYPFEFTLPATVPSSFTSKNTGRTLFSAKALVRWDKADDQSAESEMIVFEPVDLNLLLPHIAEPFAKTDSKYFWTLGSKSGPLTMSVRVPSQGYVPGETIPFEVEVDNKSTFVVHRVEVAVSQHVKYYFNLRKVPEFIKVAKVELEHSQVKGGEAKAFKHSITVPERTPPTVQNNKSKHVKWKYFLTANAVVDQGHINLRVSAPIVIGTLPVGATGGRAEVKGSPTSPPPYSKADQVSSDFIKTLI